MNHFITTTSLCVHLVLIVMLNLSLRSVRLVSAGKATPWVRSLACKNWAVSNRYVHSDSPSQDVIDKIMKSQAFCFDVDSTVIAEEGIDQLASFKGVGDQVANLTKQ